MFVQWCVKGVRGRLPGEAAEVGINDDEATDMMVGGHGIRCNWWRDVNLISPHEIRQKLTSTNLDRHIHDYGNFYLETPFISLTAGCIERDAALQMNRIHEAQDVALRFATDCGAHPGYLFYCWVVVGLKPAVSIESVAEEVRELNTYTSYSDYQLEGELTAKIIVPANQIRACEKWEPVGYGMMNLTRGWPRQNLKFDEPALLSNIRELL